VKRHAFDPVSFVFGLLFAFLALFVLTGNSLADLSPLWVWTLPATAVGLLVVLYGVRRLLPPASSGSATPVVTEPDEGDPGDVSAEV
jgi:hypothetical protein